MLTDAQFKSKSFSKPGKSWVMERKTPIETITWDYMDICMDQQELIQQNERF